MKSSTLILLLLVAALVLPMRAQGAPAVADAPHSCPTMDITGPSSINTGQSAVWTVTTSAELPVASWNVETTVNQNGGAAKTIHYDVVSNNTYNPYFDTSFDIQETFSQVGTYQVRVSAIEAGYNGCSLDAERTVEVTAHPTPTPPPTPPQGEIFLPLVTRPHGPSH